MAPAVSLSEGLARHASRFAGQMLGPSDPGYDEARRVHNGLIDKRPAVIARCRGVADIVDAIGLARATGLEVAVRGGGHNVAGRATVDDGIMIDLSGMRSVHVDPVRATARAEGGANWGDFNRATQLHGLATTGGVVSSTGVAGLTLGGGLGWLMSKHGLALDNLISADVVTADGQVLQASAISNPDLFWALRGGGGNFGIAASLEYQLHPLGPTVSGGLIAHPIAAGRDVLRFYRDVTAALPDEMTVIAGLGYAGDGSGTQIAAILPSHCGPLDEAARALAGIRAFGAPLLDAVGPIAYSDLNGMLDDGYPRGALNYWKSQFLNELSDAAIDTMLDCYTRCPSAMSKILIEHVHGAPTRVAVGDTAFPHRREGYNLLVLCQWADAAQTPACIAWARETYAALTPFMGSGRYVNYLDDDEEGDPVAAAYGPNYRRLQQVKAVYDPGNGFHMNQNIRPAA